MKNHDSLSPEEAQARILQLEQQLHQRNFELEVLADLSQQISYPLTDKELLVLLLEKIHTALPIDVCAGVISNPDGSCDFIVRSLRSLDDAVMLDIEQRLAEGFEVMGGEAITCNLNTEAKVLASVGVATQESATWTPHVLTTSTVIQAVGSVFLVPMIVEHASHKPFPTLAGMLLIAAEAEEVFNQADIHFLYTVANQGATSLKQLRSHLSAEKQRLDSIVANLPVGVLLLDADYHIAILNQLAQNHLSCLTSAHHSLQDPLEYLGDRPLSDWLEHYASSEATRQQTTQSSPAPMSQAVKPVWLEITSLQDPECIFEAGLQPLFRQDEPNHWLLVIRDVSEQKATERFKDELIAVISHELRTPLSLIQGPLGLLATGELGTLSEPGQYIVDIATEGLQRLSRVVHDVVDLAHFESGRIKLSKQHCLAQDVVERAIQANISLALEEQIELENQPEDFDFWGDPNYIIQALSHLINNAIKFSTAGSMVWVSTQLQQEDIIFTVRDQGSGIPQDKLNSIFGRFRQVDMSATREGNGLGLGLTVCQFIAQHHGGKILVDSTLKEGSVFSLRFPQFSKQPR